MTTIRITSNPYKRTISYERLTDEGIISIAPNNSDISEKMKLLSTEYADCFFPFKAYEITKQIWEAYRTNSEPVVIQFKGTVEEYEELCAACDILNTEIASAPDIQYEGVSCIQDDKILSNARDILPEVKTNFDLIMSLLKESITGSESKGQIDEQQERFYDVSKEEIPICVIGNYSSGKSTFINALIGMEILPSRDTPMTAKVYEIRSSGDSVENATVIFKFKGKPITINFIKDGYELFPHDAEMPDDINDLLESDKELELPQRLQSFLQRINDCDVDDYIKLSVPFFINSPLRSPQHPFVLFDTPGDNVANHNHHLEVLQNALHGMSNGLMLYVTVSTQMHTMSNQALCEKIKAIPEIDTRFTMVIVNQADRTNFNNISEKVVIESTIPDILKPEGIYYASSIMALGARTNGKFITPNRDFKNQRDDFVNSQSDYYQQLFIHNIAPKQIRQIMNEDSKQNCETTDENQIIFTNSGLYWIERELKRFAVQYAPYNKCYQSLLFLIKVQQIAAEDIVKTVAFLDDAKAKFQRELENESEKLRGQLYNCRDAFVPIAVSEYGREMLAAKKDAFTPLSKSEVVKLEATFTQAQEEATGFSEAEKGVDLAWDKMINIRNIFNAEKRAEWLSDFRQYRSKASARDDARKSIDVYAAGQLLDQVKSNFEIAISTAQAALFQASTNYWKNKAEELRQKLLSIVLGSSDISMEKRKELQTLIEDFEVIAFSGETEEIFSREDFERHALTLGSFTFFEKHTLNTGRLTSRYNSTLKDGIHDMYIRMCDRHEQQFHTWKDELFAAIESHLTELNPNLRKAQDQIAFFMDRINTLERANKTLTEYIEKINLLMDWKPLLSTPNPEQ